MKTRAAIASALVTAFVVTAPVHARSKPKPSDEPDLSGTYTITKGALPDGSPYEGTLTIEPKTRMGGKRGSPLWGLTWKVSSTSDPVRGIGMWVNGAFFVAYGPDDDYGLAVFLPIRRGARSDWMLADDTLWGLWCTPTGLSGREGLRGDLDAWNGDYRLHGHTVAGGEPVQPYVGNVSMTPSGEIIRLRWSGRYTKGKDKPFEYPGIGLEAPGFLAAQWSHSGKGGVGVYVFEGDTLTGLFAEDEGLGKETLSVPADVVARVAPFLDR
jgi:hypothetical protein